GHVRGCVAVPGPALPALGDRPRDDQLLGVPAAPADADGRGAVPERPRPPGRPRPRAVPRGPRGPELGVPPLDRGSRTAPGTPPHPPRPPGAGAAAQGP